MTVVMTYWLYSSSTTVKKAEKRPHGSLRIHHMAKSKDKLETNALRSRNKDGLTTPLSDLLHSQWVRWKGR